MKNKTKKSLVAWAAGILFAIVVGFGSWLFGTQVGITSFPALIQACGWLMLKVVCFVTGWRGW